MNKVGYAVKRVAVLFFVVVTTGIDVALAERAIYSVRAIEPRQFGYHLGDYFTRQLQINVAPDIELIPAGLPETGKLAPWLRLSSSGLSQSTSGNHKRYQIALVYQIIGINESEWRIEVPGYTLELQGRGEQYPVVVRPLTIDIASLVPKQETILAPLAPIELKSAVYPGRMWIACLTLAVLTTGYIIYRRYRRFRSREKQNHFNHAHHQLRQLSKSALPDSEQARRLLHEAFNKLWGRTLFESNIDQFLADWPRFRALDQEIREFFLESTETFFGGTATSSSDQQVIASAISLSERCARLERRS